MICQSRNRNFMRFATEPGEFKNSFDEPNWTEVMTYLTMSFVDYSQRQCRSRKTS